MNLADAIRQAAQMSGTTPAAPAPQTLEVVEQEAKAVPAPIKQPAKPTPLPKMPEAPDAADQAIAPLGGNMVRLELFLSPEQLNGVLRSVVATQHSILTLREAAAYLRLPVQTVEQMAHDKQIPALMIDGKWRFTHSAIEEWFGMQSKIHGLGVQERGA